MRPPPVISVVAREGARYPDPDGYYSPSERYPEWPGEPVPVPNETYRMVRDLLRQAGFDSARFGSEAWNPLGAYIAPGSRVFVLCNFVYQRRHSESEEALFAKCVHGSVLRALVDYVLKATGPGGTVSFGNGPLQSGDWERVLAETGAARVREYYLSRGIHVVPRDLRLHVIERDRFGVIHRVEDRDPGDTVEVDLRSDSLLSELPGHNDRFRVSDYDPRRTEACHQGGSHKYLIHRAVLESDVVISLAKLKTHEKVGVTCGLKGFVGAVTHKHCLAHHRFGTPASGGDEYASNLVGLNLASWFHDWVHMRQADAPFQAVFQIADRYMRAGMRRIGVRPVGGWYGNDTAWRMSLDLARILHLASADGAMQETPQRTHLSLIDGIVAGEGEGPLNPTPVRSGALLFADDVAAGDRVACRLMGFNPSCIPLIREAFEPRRYRLPTHKRDDARVVFNGALVAEKDLPLPLGRPFRPPAGWRARLPG